MTLAIRRRSRKPRSPTSVGNYGKANENQRSGAALRKAHTKEYLIAPDYIRKPLHCDLPTASGVSR